MRSLRQRLARAGAASVIAAGLLGLSASSALAVPGWVTEMDGSQVVPGPGDDDGFGIALLAYIDPGAGDLCWTVSVELIDEVTAVQILFGPPGDPGILVFDLSLLQDDFGRFKDCVGGQDSLILQDIVDNPFDYFFQVSTTEFQGGAIRGQLEGVEVVNDFRVVTMLCPEGIDTLEEARAAGAGGPSTSGEFNVCAATYPSEYPPADAPYPWYVEPIETDLDVRILPAGWSERIIVDAIFQFGDGVCSPDEGWCTSTGWFNWDSIPMGEVDVWQETIPEGYQFGWTEHSDDGVGGIIGDTETVSMTLDANDNEVNVTFFNVVEAAVVPPTPAPTQPGVPAPTLSITPPPTSTVESSGGGSSSMALVLALLVVAGLGSLAVSVVRRGARPLG